MSKLSRGALIAIAAAALLALAGRGWAQETEPPPAAPAAPADDAIRLSDSVYPAGVSDRAGYDAFLIERTDRLFEQASAAADPAVRAELWLAAANWVLSKRLEPPLSRLLQELGDAGDGAWATEALAKAREALTRCQAAMTAASARSAPAGEVEAGGDEADADALAAPANENDNTSDSNDSNGAPRDEPVGADNGDEEGEDDASGHDSVEDLRATYDLLTDLASAFELLWADPPADPDALGSAASRLASYLEHPDPEVSVAATLWQAVLLHKAGHSERALDILDVATRPPSAEGLVHQYFCRLERCRVLVDRGAYEVALALLAGVEESCQEWFVDQPVRGEAIRSAALARVKTLRRWGESLAGEADAEPREWCDRQIEQTRGRLFGGEDAAAVLRLPYAIPQLLSLPDEPPEPGPATGTQPPKPTDGAKPSDAPADPAEAPPDPPAREGETDAPPEGEVDSPDEDADPPSEPPEPAAVP